MIETQKNRIDAMTREELQGILIDSDLYTPEVIEYVKSRLRGTTWQQSSYAASEARPKAHIGFSSAYRAFFKNYVNFKGRSRRSELWYVGLANVLIMLIAYILLIPDFISMSEGIGDIANQMIEIIVIVGFLFIYELICFVPNLSLSVRRLHDIGKSGWYLLMGCIPIIGTIILFVYSVTDSDSGDNRYGKNPKLYPDKVHENKSGAVLTVILSALAVAIAVSAFRVVDFMYNQDNAVMNVENITEAPRSISDGSDDITEAPHSISDGSDDIIVVEQNKPADSQNKDYQNISIATPKIYDAEYIYYPNSDGETYKVRWDPVANATEYQVEIKYYGEYDAGQYFETMDATNLEYETAGSESFTDKVRVRAVRLDKDGKKVYSDWSTQKIINVCGGGNRDYLDWKYLSDVKKTFKIPDSILIRTVLEEPYYWDAGDCYIINVSFYQNDTLIASAGCDYNTGELVREIYAR